MTMMRRTMAVAAVAVPAMFMVPAIGSAQEPVCSAEMLSATTQQEGAPTPNGQNKLRIVLTNTSAQSCLVQGYPGVDLAGPDNPTFGPTYSLPRQETGFAPVEVAPGSSRGQRADLPGGRTGRLDSPHDRRDPTQHHHPVAGAVAPGRKCLAPGCRNPSGHLHRPPAAGLTSHTLERGSALVPAIRPTRSRTPRAPVRAAPPGHARIPARDIIASSESRTRPESRA